MSSRTDLTTLERTTYADSFRDGIIDLFFGLSVLWIGSAWIWLPDFAALAGIIPAALVVPVVEIRKRVVEPRTGFVRWSETRRRTERTRAAQMLALGVLGFGAAVAVPILAPPEGENLAAAIPAALLGLVALALGLASGVWRALAYGVALVGAGIASAVVGADPGADMLAAGGAITLWALLLAITYVIRHPVR